MGYFVEYTVIYFVLTTRLMQNHKQRNKKKKKKKKTRRHALKPNQATQHPAVTVLAKMHSAARRAVPKA